MTASAVTPDALDTTVTSTRLRRVRTVADALMQRAARRAAVEALILLPILVAIPVAAIQGRALFGNNVALRVIAAVVMVALGWAFARDIGRMARPLMFRKLAAEASGPVDFLMRAAMLVVVAGVALNVAGVGMPALATTGTVGVVLLGLAAQQSLGNIFAGFVLLGVHPYHIGDTVRLQGGGLAGAVEGRVAAMGLFYTQLLQGDDRIHVPNASVLNSGITPLRQPDTLDFRATLAPGIMPTEVQTALRTVTTRTRNVPRVEIEEVDQDHVIVRISATPRDPEDGAQLADEVVTAIAPITG